jgi:glycogen operon protein
MASQISSPPLGAIWDGSGVHFSIFSEHAEVVELCLFTGDQTSNGQHEQRITLTQREGFIWSAFVPGIRPGQQYGYRVHGPYDPEKGHRFNPSKLLIDPYAKALSSRFDGHASSFGYDMTQKGATANLKCSDLDSASDVPKSIVIADDFNWAGDQPLIHPWDETIIYETHVKGLTQLCQEIPPEYRGTYAGLGHQATIDYLCELGVTSLELLPVFHFTSKPNHLKDTPLSNYWGYDPLNFFSPHSAYCSAGGEQGRQVTEFKQMVKDLHSAGIEVILDVVYNHTGEGDQFGPTLSFRGIDNSTYYRLLESDPSQYLGEYTGCGNSLNLNHPQVLKLIMDSLRYWVQEMHVDGFRFDLASTLARSKPVEIRVWNGIDRPQTSLIHRSFDPDASFFAAIHQDPVLSRTKLISESWDCGPQGYQLGRMPQCWREWNDKYRDAVRQFWSYGNLKPKEFAARVAGSYDIFPRKASHGLVSINYLTCHDGFTLADLVSYNEKHNDANLESAGWGMNFSSNCGHEGPSDDPAIKAIREKRKRSMLALLFLSKGVPMLLGGDEIGRSQAGNNNAYCQDNELSWYNWQQKEDHHHMTIFVQELIKLRKNLTLFTPATDNSGRESIAVIPFTTQGDWIIQEQEIGLGSALMLAYCDGPGITVDQLSMPERISSDQVRLLLLLNGSSQEIGFRIPPLFAVESWLQRIDTSLAQDIKATDRQLSSREEIAVSASSLFAFEPTS